MIAYICDMCNTVIDSSEERYIVKVSEANHRIKIPRTVCLCSDCAKAWENRLREFLPQLFSNMEVRER